MTLNRTQNPQVQAGLIRIYHKLKVPPGEAHQRFQHQLLANSTHDAILAAATTSSRGHEDHESPRTSIEFSSPMKRIIDLIGHHAPVIVLDPSDDSPSENSPPPPPPLPLVSNQLQQSVDPSSAQNTLVGPAMSSTGNNQQQLPGEQSQASVMVGAGLGDPRQHWTILDTSQHGQFQQQQLQPQQQQLIQSTVPNEQYFTFTPFGLAPTSNPYGPQMQPQQSFISYPTQAAPHQFQSFPGAQQLSQQSSQNQQQMVGQQPQQQQQQNEIQPVFLSSYVPELPPPPGQQSTAQFQPAQPVTQQQQQGQPQSQQPNSIQQIQQAQAQEASDKQQEGPDQSDGPGGGDSDAGSSSPSKRDEDSDSGEPPDKSNGGEPDDDSLEEPQKSTQKRASSNGPSEGPGGDPNSGSMSYENKFDSDKDDEPQVQQRNSAPSHNTQQVAAAPRRKSGTPNGLINVGLNDDCLQCICRASSGCDHLLRCITIGAEEKYCGPFQLTEEYWQRAGSPGDAQNNFSSFEDCANDADCAVETVTNYMKKNFKDCDGDENVTCMDYARLHRLRPNECSQTARLFSKDHESYWEKFQRCAEGYNRTRNGDDEDI